VNTQWKPEDLVRPIVVDHDHAVRSSHGAHAGRLEVAAAEGGGSACDLGGGKQERTPQR
jgi:hypothetical protein